MDFGLHGRVALVAAASRGLGYAAALALAREGARLAICARNQAALERAAREIHAATGAPVLAVPADVADACDLERLVERTLAAYGRIDVLVSNGGGPPPGPFEAHAPEAWRRAVTLVLESVINLIRPVLPGMRERRWGRIVGISSIAAARPVDGLILSNAPRPAVGGLLRALALEAAPHGVTVNAVLAGYMRTERVESLAADAAARAGGDVGASVRRWLDEIPLGRLGEPDELGNVVAFLASERASYLTGQAVAVDGGWIR